MNDNSKTMTQINGMFLLLLEMNTIWGSRIICVLEKGDLIQSQNGVTLRNNND